MNAKIVTRVFGNVADLSFGYRRAAFDLNFDNCHSPGTFAVVAEKLPHAAKTITSQNRVEGFSCNIAISTQVNRTDATETTGIRQQTRRQRFGDSNSKKVDRRSYQRD